jgi:hypothetical protein
MFTQAVKLRSEAAGMRAVAVTVGNAAVHRP